jgi:4-hydroxy-tetrahydrodipicolinate synthase
MSKDQRLHGIFAAAVTPMDSSGNILENDLVPYLDFLARNGCHGALLFGTAGEGTSLSRQEKINLLKEAVKIKRNFPEFKLLAGAGSPSLTETIELSRNAFSFPMDGIVVLPPYYYRNVDQSGIIKWFSQLLDSVVPGDGLVYGYHFPKMTGIPLSVEILEELRSRFPENFAGIKDSSGDQDNPMRLKTELGSSIQVFVGNDRLLSSSLEQGADGCITALSNVCSKISREIWDGFHQGYDFGSQQDRLNHFRGLVEENLPTPVFIKFLLREMYGLPEWGVRAPLVGYEKSKMNRLKQTLDINC